jgi:Secretion system C-terminal sorting domain
VHVYVTSSNGTTVYDAMIKPNKSSGIDLNVKQFDPGIYFITIDSKGKSFRTKFIVR